MVVTDNVPPVVSCANFDLDSDPDGAGRSDYVFTDEASATDNCPLTTSFTPASPADLQNGPNDITFTANDGSNAPVDCDFVATVVPVGACCGDNTCQEAVRESNCDDVWFEYQSCGAACSTCTFSVFFFFNFS